MQEASWIMPQSPSGEPRHVFVYGTLRAGGTNDIRRYAPAPAFVGGATVAGVLHDLGAYPGMVLGGSSSVRGEVYRIDSDLEAALDRLEEVTEDDSGEYVKRYVAVMVRDVSLRCLVYEIHPSRIAQPAVIDSGDWLEYLVSSKRK